MARLSIFNKALAETEKLRTTYPDVVTLESIVNQLKYLADLATGRSSDRSRLKEIIIGIQAAREVESLSQSVADLLYQADEEARRM